jgi:hypothetical protein
VNVWWYDGGDLPPDEVREPLGAQFPPQGSILVGTTGMLVLPHISPGPFAVSGDGMVPLPSIDVPDRDHYREFVDAVLGGSRTRCSANFDYAGPLTESVLIGNVAAHFPGETLDFDARALAFPNRPEANAHLTRAYRHGWTIRG